VPALSPVLALIIALLLGCSSGSHEADWNGGGDGSVTTQASPPATLSPTANDSPAISNLRRADEEAGAKATPTATLLPPPTPTPVRKLCGEHIPKNTTTRWRPSTDAYWDLQILDRAPGYGGSVFSKDGSIFYVYMLDTSQKQIARQAFEQFRPDLISEGLEFRILQGQYDMEQLHRWESCIKEAENSGDLFFAFVVVRNEANRVFICLFEHADERLIRGSSQNTRNQLQEIGVPLEAVILQRGLTCQPQTSRLNDGAGNGF